MTKRKKKKKRAVLLLYRRRMKLKTGSKLKDTKCKQRPIFKSQVDLIHFVG